MSNDKEKVLWYWLVGNATVLVIIGIVFLGILLRAFVLIRLWAWFVTPFFGLPYLPSYAEAVGLMALLSFLLPTAIPKKGEETDSARLFAAVLVNPLIALGIGYVASLFL